MQLISANSSGVTKHKQSDVLNIRYYYKYTGVRVKKKKYCAEVTHSGLKEHRVLSDDDDGILHNKVASYVSKLNEKWDKIITKDTLNTSMKVKSDYASNILKTIDRILIDSLNHNALKWTDMEDNALYSEIYPKSLEDRLANIPKPISPVIAMYPNEPIYSKPTISVFTRIFFNYKVEGIIRDSETAHIEAVACWSSNCNSIDNMNEINRIKLEDEMKKYEIRKKELEGERIAEITIWEKNKRKFEAQQRLYNVNISNFKNDYEKGEQHAIIKFSDLVLQKSSYPIDFQKNISIDYNITNQVLLVNYSLPTIEAFPTLGEVKILKEKLEEKHLSNTQIEDIFDSTSYKITLRSINELFRADSSKKIKMIVFNGWVNAMNKAIGKKQNTCILSIQVKREEFTEIDLRYIEPKQCFKSLKGVGSSKLSGMVAIQPIMQISREDKRFTTHYGVAGELDNSTNLAAMDWADFEHLIREIFEKEFSGNGGEVRVTQASRDGGVDAIAFDPDPIRGGKIVIQAKRYTNVVGVSAVRDLYGTVMNEGATKGILVTTSDYGTYSYEFVKGKPLTLMNGSNLLHLLEKHGYKAKIDIKEAKKTLKMLG